MSGTCGKMLKTCVFSALVLFSFTINVQTLEIDLTVDVKAGYEECFFEDIKKPTSFEIEYQVIDGGDLDINFMVTSPHGRIMVSELQKTDAVHKVEATEAGVYKVCFDNSFSHFARKLVFFEIITGDDDDDDESDEKKDWKAAQEELASIVDMTVQDFKNLLDNVNKNLDKASSDQQVMKNYEARDRNTQENNFQRVNFFSGVQVFIMISVALTQVLLIRSLFEDKNKNVVTCQIRRFLIPIRTWPGGIIPYDIPEKSFDERSRTLIRVAMKRWERHTCVRFIPLSKHSQGRVEDYVRFYNSTTCFSDLGKDRNQQPQLLGLGKNCMTIPVILHELGHAIGMIHPMSRDDRGLYIDIRAKNIKPDSDRNFMTISRRGYLYFTYGVPYDYKSIMHYNPYIWSQNGNVTMVTRQPEYQSIIGNADDVSFYDKLYINRAYRCGRNCMWLYCENGGIAGGRSCQCICPDGYHGSHCEKRLPGHDRTVNWKCREGWISRNGFCYKFLSHASISWKTARQLCQQNGGSLPKIPDHESLNVMGELVLEDRDLSSTKTFWLGLKYNMTSERYTWTDGSVLQHTQWISNKEDSPCAVFNGTHIISTGCDLQPENGVLCMAPFDPSCGGKFSLRYQNVDVMTPNYPDVYPSEITCQYVFTITGDQRIELTFKDFLLEFTNNCENDYVEVQLNPDVSIPGKRYCGSQLKSKTLVSEGNFAVVTLKTNARNPGRGFQMSAFPVLRSSSVSQHSRFPANIPLSLWRRFVEHLPGRHGRG
ncbi:tolloid-like protein 2 [Ostrea edulis]|uniref:tolloid-like protein 2 n=1 Tax=Ostrea edulis TaxID=37623 RepID=UPI0024AEECEF|nr:tolloid-like protein 2 [Ostrea edulis]